MDGTYTRYTQPASSEAENRKIFFIYGIYRLVLAAILLVSFYYRTTTSPLGIIDPALFVQLCVGYAVLNVLSLFLSLLRLPPIPESVVFMAVIVIDIMALVAISFTCGGVTSGMTHLLIVPVATGSILFGLRISTFFAAVGSLAAIYAEIYLYLSTFALENYYVQAGLLGLALFVTSLTLQYLGGRIRQKEQINRAQAANIQSLQEMNQQIIQRMQTGIIVVDKSAHVLNANSTAYRLLEPEGESTEPRPTLKLPPALLEQLQQWQIDNRIIAKPFRLDSGDREIQASFTWLQAEVAANILIVLDDYSLLKSQAQHLKLLALGRLAASIAHEIRNPLGAISHASQLLEESPNASAQDKRLIDIINTHSNRVNTIIQSILELSRHRQDLPEKVAMQSWLEGFIERFRNSYREPLQTQVLVNPPDLVVYFNPGQLEQLLTNLCDNAVRYSKLQTGSGSFRIIVGMHSQTNSPVLDVVDDGTGVAADKAEQIFEPFFTTEHSGTGLGLFICRGICEANRAQIFFRRTEEGKSCFRVMLAHIEQSAVPAVPSGQPARGSH